MLALIGVLAVFCVAALSFSVVTAVELRRVVRIQHRKNLAIAEILRATASKVFGKPD